MPTCTDRHDRITYSGDACPMCRERAARATLDGWTALRDFRAALAAGDSDDEPITLAVIIPAVGRGVVAALGSLEWQVEPADDVVVVRGQKGGAWNKGQVINEGIRRAKDTTHVLLLDADIALHPGALARIRVWLQSHGSVAISPLDVDPRVGWTAADFDLAALLGAVRGPDQVGGCVAYPREWLVRSGGMDEGYPGKGYHDLDLWRRAERDLGPGLLVPASERLALHQRHPVTVDEEQIEANRKRYESRWGSDVMRGAPGGDALGTPAAGTLSDSGPVTRQIVREEGTPPSQGNPGSAAFRYDNEPFAPAIAITTYQRPALLLDLLGDIEREFGASADVRVYDDGSTDDYSAVVAFLAERGWRWSSRRHGGKPGFWRLLGDALGELRHDPGPHLLLQDDLRLCRGFATRLQAAWDALPAEDRGSLQVLRQEVPSRPGRWDLSRAPRVGDAYLTGRWDCICLIGPRLLEAFDYRLPPVDPGRWEADPDAASGVDLPVLAAARQAGLKLYTVANSLVDHVEPGVSLLNPLVRPRSPVYAGGYVDRERPMVLYLGAHEQNAGWGSEGAIGRALEQHATVLRVDYRATPAPDLLVLLRQPPGTWDAVFVQHGGGLSGPCMDALAAHPVAFFASEAAVTSLRHHREILERCRPAMTIAHDPAIVEACEHLGLSCELMINGYDDGAYTWEDCKKVCDVAFVGKMTERRELFFSALRFTLGDRPVFAGEELDPAAAARIYNSARVVVHVHAGGESYVPTRLLEALPTSAAFVSEDFGREVNGIEVPTFPRSDVGEAARIVLALLDGDRWQGEARRQADLAPAHTWARRVEDVIWPAVSRAVAVGGHFRPGAVALPGVPTVDVILTAYRRDHFARQIEAVMGQTVRPASVTIWQNEDHVCLAEHLDRWPEIQHVQSSENLRFHGRFALALLGDAEYVAIFDDDCIPGPRWLETAIHCSEEHGAIVGANGRTYDPATLEQSDAGGGIPSDVDQRVDLVGHCWVLRREWLRAMWAEPVPSWANGEDIHIAAACSIRLGVPCYVPAQPADDRDCWGDGDVMLGADDVATYRRADHRPLRLDLIRQWRARGWRLSRETP
jgi:GT2 family glycosyltransferase